MHLKLYSNKGYIKFYRKNVIQYYQERINFKLHRHQIAIVI